MAEFSRACAVVMLIVMTAGVLLSGCTTTSTTGTPTPTTVVATTATTTGTPTITITSPTGGATVSAGNVTVTAMVSNFTVVDKQGQASVAGQGHVHFYMDVSPPSTAGQPAIPTDKGAAWAHVSGTTYTFTNVTAGQHTIAVQLVNNDHTPVIPIVTDSVTVTATGSSATTQPATTAATTTSATTTRSSGGSSGY